MVDRVDESPINPCSVLSNLLSLLNTSSIILPKSFAILRDSKVSSGLSLPLEASRHFFSSGEEVEDAEKLDEWDRVFPFVDIKRSNRIQDISVGATDYTSYSSLAIPTQSPRLNF